MQEAEDCHGLEWHSWAHDARIAGESCYKKTKNKGKEAEEGATGQRGEDYDGKVGDAGYGVSLDEANDAERTDTIVKEPKKVKGELLGMPTLFQSQLFLQKWMQYLPPASAREWCHFDDEQLTKFANA